MQFAIIHSKSSSNSVLLLALLALCPLWRASLPPNVHVCLSLLPLSPFHACVKIVVCLSVLGLDKVGESLGLAVKVVGAIGVGVV